MEDMVEVKFFMGIETDVWEEFNDDTIAELTKGRGDIFVPPAEGKKKVVKSDE